MTEGQQRLAAWIRRTGLKQYEAAALLKITGAYLSQVLGGHRRPGLPIAVRIARETGVAVESWVTTVRGGSDRRRKHAADPAPVSQE